MAMSTGGKLVAAFILLLIGVILVSTISTSVLTTTALSTVTDTFSLAPARLAGGAVNNTYPFKLSGFGDYREDYTECSSGTLITSGATVVAKNSSGATLTMNGCDAGGEYYFVEGINEINFCNNKNVNQSNSNTTTITHPYCGSNYNITSWGRTATNLTVGLMAIAVFLGSVGFFYSVGKDTGIIS